MESEWAMFRASVPHAASRRCVLKVVGAVIVETKRACSWTPVLTQAVELKLSGSIFPIGLLKQLTGIGW